MTMAHRREMMEEESTPQTSPLKFAPICCILIACPAGWRGPRRIDTLNPAIVAEAARPPLKPADDDALLEYARAHRVAAE